MSNKSLIISALMNSYAFDYDVAETIYISYWVMGDLDSLQQMIYEKGMADFLDL